jgi:AraC-like DNA-binding protein
MSDTVFFVSYSAHKKRNRNADSIPFSGMGMEFLPLGVLPDQSGVLLHEAGFAAKHHRLSSPNVPSPFWRLFYTTRPGHKLVFSDTEYELTADHVVLIPDQQLFQTQANSLGPSCWMHFQVGRRLDPQQKIPIRLRLHPLEIKILNQLRRHFTGLGRGNREAVLHTSLALLHLLLIRPEINWMPNRPPDFLHLALRRIETEYAKGLSMPDLARTSGLSVRGFAQAFKKLQGMTPGRFLSQVRLRESAFLLVNTQLSIEKIAERVGFPNRHYFSRIFKRDTGDSPAHFRAQHGGDLPRGA